MNRLGLNQISTAGADATNDTPRFNPATGRVEYAPAASASPTQVVREGFTAAAGDDLLTLGGTPVAGTPYVWVGGALLWPGIHYTLDGNVITLNTPLTGGESVWLSFETSDTPVPSTLGQASSGYADEVLADSPLAYWRLGEASGTIAADSSGNDRPGSYLNGPTLGAAGLTSDPDTAMGMADESGQCVYVPAAAWMAAAQLTVECLVRFTSPVDAVSGDAIVTSWSGGFQWMLWRNGSGQLEARFSVASGSTATLVGPALAADTTYHPAFTYDGSALRLYLDATLVASTTGLSGRWHAASPIEIGRYSGSNGTTPGGVIDEVAIYGTALSSARIAAHYAAA